MHNLDDIAVGEPRRAIRRLWHNLEIALNRKAAMVKIQRRKERRQRLALRKVPLLAIDGKAHARI
jgi:hypothetical protein